MYPRDPDHKGSSDHGGGISVVARGRRDFGRRPMADYVSGTDFQHYFGVGRLEDKRLT